MREFPVGLTFTAESSISLRQCASLRTVNSERGVVWIHADIKLTEFFFKTASLLLLFTNIFLCFVLLHVGGPGSLVSIVLAVV